MVECQFSELGGALNKLALELALGDEVDVLLWVPQQLIVEEDPTETFGNVEFLRG